MSRLTPNLQNPIIPLMAKIKPAAAGNSVILDRRGIIVVDFKGPQSIETIRDVYGQIEGLVALLRGRNKKVWLLVDISHLRPGDTSSETRTESKIFMDVPHDGIVLVGKGLLLTTVLYIIKVARPHQKVQYFSSRRKAWVWFQHKIHPSVLKPTLSLVAGCVIGLIGVITLIGWQLHMPGLRSWLSGAPQMNPIVAFGLIDVCYGFVSYWAGAYQNLRRMGYVGLLLGIVALLPIPIDHLLYGDQVTQSGTHALVSGSSAICLMAMGVVGLVAARREWWVRKVEYLMVIIMASIATLNIFGVLYDRSFVYGLSGHMVMAVSTSVAFEIAAASLYALVIYRQGKNVLDRISPLGWLIITALVLVQAGTYSIWIQAVNRNRDQSMESFVSRSQTLQNSVNARIQVYIDALQGYQGFYAASDTVTQKDFYTYYQSLDLESNYPGLRSIAYIAVVTTPKLASFEKSIQRDTSLFANGNPNFYIKSETAAPIHYIATYSAEEPKSSALGIDLTSVTGRSAIYGAAVASGKDYASGTVTFLKTATLPAKKGFFITIPVKTNTSSTYTGLVNASFNYENFFPAVIVGDDLQKGLDIRISENGQTIYHVNHLVGNAAYAHTTPVRVGVMTWQLSLRASKNFGVSSDQASLPMATLLAGQTFSVLIGLIFILQNRARKEALELATEINGDLERERNHIVELHTKDEAILGGIGEGLVALNAKGGVERVNGAAEKLLGMSEKELAGKQFYEMVPATNMEGNSVPHAKRPATQALKGHKPITEKLYYIRPDGNKFPVELNVAPIILEGKVIGAIEVFRDITHDYELDKVKSEFVSLASHQLRTPLSAVNWYAEMLLNGDAGKLNKDQAEYLKEIFEGNQRMVELVNSLLDVSRLELGRMAYNPVPVDIKLLVADIEKELMTTITTKQLVVQQHVPAKLELVVGDPKQLRMVVQNLFSNAVKYTDPKGTVQIKLLQLPMDQLATYGINSTNPHLLFSVTDDGYGIPVAQQSHIFEKLFRADNVRKLDVEGTGLGLYIVKQVVEGMAGKVWFESIEGKGTTFNVVLPFQAKA